MDNIAKIQKKVFGTRTICYTFCIFFRICSFIGINTIYPFYYYCGIFFLKSRIANKLAEASTYSKRSPLEDACPLMSSSARSETANLVSATSGTERERGFVGIGACRSAPLGM